MPKSIEYYLSKGFDPKTAAYFAKGRRTVTGVIPNDDFTLTLSFDNGETRLYNAAPLLLPGTVFAPLAEIKNFRRVYIDNEHCIAWDIDLNVDSSVVWNNKIDLCPDTCYMDSVPLSDAEL